MPEDMKVSVPALPIAKPKPRSSRKLLAFLLIFFVTVLVILFFQSSLSRISAIEITGNELLSTSAIGQASMIKVGDNFFATNPKVVQARMAAMKMVQSADVTRHFPGIITIHIQEYPKVAFQLGSDGKKEALLADGSAVPIDQTKVEMDKPILTGWSPDDLNKIKLCKVLGNLSAEVLSDISEIKPDPSDVYPDKIKMYTRSQFEVYTTVTYLPDKMNFLPSYIMKLKDDNIVTGVLSLLEVDNHIPFGQDGAKPEEKDKEKDIPSKKPDKKANVNTTIDSKKDPVKDRSKVPIETIKPNSKETGKAHN